MREFLITLIDTLQLMSMLICAFLVGNDNTPVLIILVLTCVAIIYKKLELEEIEDEEEYDEE